MEPKRLLWLLIFVYSARWLVPAQLQSQPEKEITNTKVTSFVPYPGYENYNEIKISSIMTQVLLKRNTSLDRKEIILTKATSLTRLLAAVVQKSLSDCHLVLMYNANSVYSVVVQDLLMLLSNTRKVGMVVISLICFCFFIQVLLTIFHSSIGIMWHLTPALPNR